MTIRCSACFEQYESEYFVCPSCGHYAGAPPAEPFYIGPGALLQGRYTVGAALGFGGFGVIYKAWDNKYQNLVAIKEYFPSGIVSRAQNSAEVAVYAKKREKEFEAGFARFIDEAGSMAAFGSHANIVNVYGCFEENRTAYIVMEYLDGVTLSEYIKANELTVEDALAITLNVCEALKAIHASGIVHRDVSPDNIFICADYRVKLIDFGTARFSQNEDTLLTVILKPGYSPPEQYETINAQGPWTDIYAVGATLYFMLTGVKPDESTNRKIDDTLLPPSELNPDAPEYISNTVMKALAIDRHMRFKTVEEFTKGLNQDIKVVPLSVEIKNRKTRRLLSVLSAAFLVVAAFAGLVCYFNMRMGEGALRAATISVWYGLSGDEAHDAAKRGAYGAVFNEFLAIYPNITITEEAFAGEDYMARLTEAVKTGAAPALFETTGIDKYTEGVKILAGAADLGPVAEGLSSLDEYYFMANYGAYFPSRNRLPLGFIAPAVYINNNLAAIPDGGAGVADILEDAIGGEATDYELFAAGGSGILVSDTARYFDVQAALAAQYTLLRAEGAENLCRFTDLWSVSALSGKDEIAAAERLLAFMLSENAQDLLYIRNRTGKLPLNKNALAEFVGVHDEFIGFFDNIGSYMFPQAD